VGPIWHRRPFACKATNDDAEGNASAIGFFVIPMLYVVFQSLRERSGSLAQWPKNWFKRISFK
jgi:hypothetical protein